VPIDSLQPVETEAHYYGPRTEFFVATQDINFGGGECSAGTCSGIFVLAFSNPIAHDSGGAAPQLSAFAAATPTYALPPNATTPGCSACLDTNDTRISATPHYRAGSIYLAFETGASCSGCASAVPAVDWMQVTPQLDDGNAGCGAVPNLCTDLTGAKVVNQGIYGFPSSANFFGALVTDEEGNLLLVEDYSSATTYPSILLADRRVTQDSNPSCPNCGGLHDSGSLLQAGLGGTSDTRWGDYSAWSWDGFNTDRVWVAAQYAPGSTDWATTIARVNFNLNEV
jgi:hypothetical protein